MPYLVVVGDKEVAETQVSVRTRGGKDLGNMTLPQFAALLGDKVAERGRANVED